jgi:beta-xylosidase
MATSYRKLAPVLLLGLCCSGPGLAKQVEVHDPVMTREGDTYYVFSTGPGITFYESADLKQWKLTGRVFEHEPSWARRVAPGFNGHLWAPDIYQKDGRFYLYYSASFWQEYLGYRRHGQRDPGPRIARLPLGGPGHRGAVGAGP